MSHQPPRRAKSSTAVLSGRSKGIADTCHTKLHQNCTSTNKRGWSSTSLHFYLLFFQRSTTWQALMTCLQKKGFQSGFSDSSLWLYTSRWGDISPRCAFFLYKKKGQNKKESSVWPLCGASSFVSCLSACSWWKGTFSLTELERKTSAYSRPYNLLAKISVGYLKNLPHSSVGVMWSRWRTKSQWWGPRLGRGEARREEQRLDLRQMCAEKPPMCLCVVVFNNTLLDVSDGKIAQSWFLFFFFRVQQLVCQTVCVCVSGPLVTSDFFIYSTKWKDVLKIGTRKQSTGSNFDFSKTDFQEKSFFQVKT